MDTERIIDLLETLPAHELRRVLARAQELDQLYTERQNPDYIPRDNKTYQQEYVRCGKPTCKKCKDGAQGHGPYWYAYWTENGKTRKEYIGKNRREALDGQQQHKLLPTDND